LRTTQETCGADVQGVVEQVAHVLEEPLLVLVDLVSRLEHIEDGRWVIATNDCLAVVVDCFDDCAVFIRSTDYNVSLKSLPVEETTEDVINGDGMCIVVFLDTKLHTKCLVVVPCVATTVEGIGVPDELIGVEPFG
jgi:hypothetical protein